MPALVGLFLLVISSFWDVTRAQNQEKLTFCNALNLPDDKYAEVYIQGIDKTFKPLREATLNDFVGRKVLACYLVSRSPEELPDGVSQRGAIVAKLEFWEPYSQEVVGLFNNHIPEAKSCRYRPFETYQNFHAEGSINYCLRYGFHNRPGDFPTFEFEDRRLMFLFQENTWIEKLTAPDSNQPLRRMSFLLNYVVPSDFATVRVPFQFWAAPDLTAIRVTISDLLETRYNQKLPTIRETFK